MNDFLEAFVPIVMFGVMGTVILLPFYWRAKERRQALDIVRLAVEREGPVPVELMTAMGSAFRARPDISPTHDRRRGYFLIALGGAIMAAGVACFAGFSQVPDEHALRIATVIGVCVGSVGILPLFVGLAYVMLGSGKRPHA